MFSKIMIGILAFLLTIFPNCASLQGQYQARTFDREAIQASIVVAIETRNVDALKAMMCKNIKDNVPDLSGKIGTLIDMINGEVIEFDWRSTGGYDKANNGKRISQTGWSLDIKTAAGEYRLGITWEISNNFAPEETGIRNMGLLFNEPGNLLALITAPDGIRHW